MKKHLLLPFIALVTLMGGLLSSCEEPQTEPVDPVTPTEFSVELGKVGADFVEVLFKGDAAEVAYLVATEPSANILPAVIFNVGVTLTPANNETVKVSEGIVPETSYYMYVVAKLNEKDYSEVFCLEFKTGAYEFTDLVTVIETYYDGYKLFVNVPDDVVEAGHAMRYTMSSLPVYNKVRNMYMTPEYQSLIFNGGAYDNTGYFKNDTTIVINAANQLKTDEDGNYITDDSGEFLTYHEPVVPGEPTVFLVGEFAYGNLGDLGIGQFGDPRFDMGYFIPQMDMETQEWYGAYAKTEFVVKEPELLDADLEIEVSDISPLDAIVTIIPDENIHQYIYAVLDVATYNSMIALIGDKKYTQWFLTSYLAYMELGVGAESGAIQFNAASLFTEPLPEQSKFYILVTAMGDEEGHSQKFFMKEFTTTAKTKAAPVIEVTALPQSDDPYAALFNVKAPNKDVVLCYYGANYARDWMLEINAGASYESLLKGNYAFTEEEIAKINSDEGLDLEFYTLDGETTRLAVYGCNDEYTFNKIDANDPDCKAFADYTSPFADPAPYVPSDLYTALEGDWTATATIKVAEEQADGSVATVEKEWKSKITLTNGAPEYPETLPQEVYDVYSSLGISTGYVDTMFEEFKHYSQEFGENRVEFQNRLLCTGFIDFDYYENPGRLDTKSPFDLFYDLTYNSVDIPQIFYDFGPKWYLEVQSDGSVLAPFSAAYLPPMVNWSVLGYFGGYNGETGYVFYESNENIKGFPVTVSDDCNTVTVNPIMVPSDNGNTYPYYPNVIGVAGRDVTILGGTVVSEIVMTRGWDESSAMAATAVKAETVSAEPRNLDGSVAKIPVAKKIKALTKFKDTPKVECRWVENPNHITLEQLNAGMERAVEKELGISIR